MIRHGNIRSACDLPLRADVLTRIVTYLTRREGLRIVLDTAGIADGIRHDEGVLSFVSTRGFGAFRGLLDSSMAIGGCRAIYRC